MNDFTILPHQVETCIQELIDHTFQDPAQHLSQPAAAGRCTGSAGQILHGCVLSAGRRGVQQRVPCQGNPFFRRVDA